MPIAFVDRAGVANGGRLQQDVTKLTGGQQFLSRDA
jgi:hypothetical protein